MNKNKMLSLLLTIAMVMSLFVIPVSAANKETTHRYYFDLAAIPEDQWNQQKCEIHVTLEEADGSKTTTIIKEEGNFGSPVFLNAKVYDKTTKKELQGQTLATYWVPARLFVEKLGLGPIEWDNERGVAVLKTYRGTVDLQPDSTYVTLPDGTQVVEETYKVGPNQQDIEVVKNRQGRIYVPCRFWLNLCFENAEFDWHRPGILYVTAKRPTTQTTEKNWVGVRNVGAEFTFLNEAKNLPHIAAAIKETNAHVALGEEDLAIRPEDAFGTGSIYLEDHDGGMGNNEVWIVGLGGYVGMPCDSETPGYLKVVKAILEDLISDPQDIEYIMNLITEADKGVEDLVGAGICKVHTLNTVIVDWPATESGGLGDMRIYNK